MNNLNDLAILILSYCETHNAATWAQIAMTCARATEGKVADFPDPVAAKETELNAWKAAFGTGQLTHAVAERERLLALHDAELGVCEPHCEVVAAERKAREKAEAACVSYRQLLDRALSYCEHDIHFDTCGACGPDSNCDTECMLENIEPQFAPGTIICRDVPSPGCYVVGDWSKKELLAMGTGVHRPRSVVAAEGRKWRVARDSDLWEWSKRSVSRAARTLRDHAEYLAERAARPPGCPGRPL